MASHTNKLELSNTEDAEAWFMALEATCSIKKEEDKNSYLIAHAGVPAIKKIMAIIAPQKINELEYEDIKNKIFSYLQPSQHTVLANRKKFLVQIKILMKLCKILQLD